MAILNAMTRRCCQCFKCHRAATAAPNRTERMGFGLYCLVSSVCVLFVLDLRAVELTLKEVLIFYRLPLLIAIMLWLWALNIAVSTHMRISISGLFNLDGDQPLSAKTAAKGAACFTALTSTWIIGRLAGAPLLLPGALHPYYHRLLHPLTMHVVGLGLLICPHNIACRKSRQLMARTLKQSVAAPYYKVQFRDVIFADILTSMSRAFTALEPMYCLVQAGAEHVHDPSRFLPLPLTSRVPRLWFGGRVRLGGWGVCVWGGSCGVCVHGCQCVCVCGALLGHSTR